jgi:hypothetical protein
MRRKNSQPLPYEERLSIACTAPLLTAVAAAADQAMTSMNSYYRTAILRQLAKDSVRLREVEEVQHP